MSKVAVQVEFRGRVQGVGFRAWVQQVGTMLDLEGWVRNRHDGGVEAVLIAREQEQLDAALGLLQRGPPGSRVEDVAVRPADESELTANPRSGFVILPDV